MTVLFAFLHHVAAFTLVGALAIEFVSIRGELNLANARKLLAADFILGVSAIFLLAVGLMRVFYFEKGSAYYFSSHAFLGKLSVFIVVALLSIVPTVEFLSWRNSVRAGQTPVVSEKKLKSIRSIIHIELAAIILILLFAAIMAKGGIV